MKSNDIQQQKHSPPMTLHERITSSPSSIGPMVVLFIMRPQRSKIIGFSGKTTQLWMRNSHEMKEKGQKKGDGEGREWRNKKKH